MKNFIIITGPMGVGKTMVGKRLCDKLKRTAFIDGDWCLDIHPFIGNEETINMAVNNILHLTKNYYLCSECDNIVLSWVMNENTVSKIVSELKNIDLKIHKIILTCNEKALIDRWKKDTITEWRNDRELHNSLQSLENYNSRTDGILIDTSNISIENEIDMIINVLERQ